MKTFKRHFMTIVFMLLCIAINADDLITSQITIKLDKAGTLPNIIGDSRKYKITNLKLIGDINGNDVKLIRDMAGADYNGNYTSGKLSILDLSEANIVTGGSYNGYYCSIEYNNKIGSYFFHRCYSLTSIVLPSSVTSIESCAFKSCN